MVLAILPTMKATLILRERREHNDGSVIEMVVWRVEQPIRPCSHFLKYRLVLLKNGRRVVGFDNERGKGDHRHVRNMEAPYAFVSLDRFLDDFIREIERWRDEP